VRLSLPVDPPRFLVCHDDAGQCVAGRAASAGSGQLEPVLMPV
jgi:hypothetical protein